MANLSKATIRKMREVIAAVLAEPKLYNQMKFPDQEDRGAVACGAGWAVWLFNPKRYTQLLKGNETGGWAREAETVLGLGYTGFDLFCCQGCWPPTFTRMYQAATTSLQRAKAMQARWEHFIATDGND